MHNVYHASYGQHPAWNPDPVPTPEAAPPAAPEDPLRKAGQVLMGVGGVMGVGGYVMKRPITGLAGGVILGIGAYMFPWGDWASESWLGKFFSKVP